MQDLDPAYEFSRLQELYRRMANEQLQALANESDELTPIARDVLQSEMRARHLTRQPPEPEADNNEGLEEIDSDSYRSLLGGDHLDLVEATRVWNVDEARRLQTALEEVGIPCFVGPQDVRDLDDFQGHFERGVQLKVPSFDAHRAGAVLKIASPETGTDESADAPIVYRCPNCQSEEVIFDESEKSADEADFQATLHWHCDTCGHKWVDES